MKKFFFLLLLLLMPSPGLAASFSDWAAVVVAGDKTASGGGETDVFDNGRRAIVQSLTHMGFAPGNIRQFSVQSGRFSEADRTDINALSGTLWTLTDRAPGGCLLYFTSHGSPQGIVMGQAILDPDTLSRMVRNSCGGKPTVVIVSACYSGVFVQRLAGPNNFVMTAARPDRTSFGCGQMDRFTYFDNCVLSALSSSHDFPTLADRTRSCVATRERQEGVAPASEPQVSSASVPFPTW